MQHPQTLSLPKPDALSQQHSDKVATYIRERIAGAGGQISFAEYMQHVLYAPGLGYYSAGTRKFGAAGDFVTAPEISPLFGRVVARQCVPVLRAMPGGSILEFGAGSGSLALEVLRTLAEADALPAEYRIMEVSADLRERQQRLLHEALPGLAGRIRWLDRLPETHRGVVIANEVLDALPVERFIRRSGGVYQLRVCDEGGEFVFVEEPAPAVLANAVAAIEDDIGARLPDGYISEVSLAAPAASSSRCERLRWPSGSMTSTRTIRSSMSDAGRSSRQLISRTPPTFRCIRFSIGSVRSPTTTSSMPADTSSE